MFKAVASGTKRWILTALVAAALVFAYPHAKAARSTVLSLKGLETDHHVTYRDVTEKAGIHFEHFHGVRSTQLPEDMGSGAAWGDYDGDGFPDLYVVDVVGPLTDTPAQLAKSTGGNRLYHNNRNGTFTDVTTKAGVGFKGIGMAAAWADYDNDGHLDLIVTAYDQIVLYHNNGDGTFADTTARAGLDKFRGFWTGAAWGDYDLDGNVDLFICGYVKYKYEPENANKPSMQYSTLVPFMLNPGAFPPERKLLLHNRGDGTFADATKEARVDDPTGRSLSAAWYDFDGDGWPDLYVANDLWGSKLYLNQRNGTFKDITREAGISDFRGEMGIAIGDWENTGNADIFVTHWIYQQNALFHDLRSTLGNSEKKSTPSLFYGDIAESVGLAQVSRNFIGWGTSFFDFDNDGRLDLFVVNGSTFQDDKDPHHLVPMRNFLFWQGGPNEGFHDAGTLGGSVMAQLHVGRGAAFADYDNDGDVDVFIVNQEGRPTLLRNDGGNSNNWLKVRVKCSKSNRTGLGTKIEVEEDGFRRTEEIGGQTSYLSQNFQETHFGLNHATEALRLKVTFPSGIIRTLEHVKANQVVTVAE